MADFYPKLYLERVSWHRVFADGVAEEGAALGLDAETIAQIETDAEAIRQAVYAVSAAENYVRATVEYRRRLVESDIETEIGGVPTPPPVLVPPAGARDAIVARTRVYAGLIKTSPNYSRAVGLRLGIVGGAAAKPKTPHLKVAGVNLSTVELRITKNGNRVLSVFSQRGEGDWELIGVAVGIRFVDERPNLVPGQPEVRRYRVEGAQRDGRRGDESNLVTAVAGP